MSGSLCVSLITHYLLTKWQPLSSSKLITSKILTSLSIHRNKSLLVTTGVCYSCRNLQVPSPPSSVNGEFSVQGFFSPAILSHLDWCNQNSYNKDKAAVEGQSIKQSLSAQMYLRFWSKRHRNKIVVDLNDFMKVKILPLKFLYYCFVS